MKYLLIATALIISGCTQHEDEYHKKFNEAMKAYEKNLATLKSSISAFEKENIDEWSANISDTTIWNSAVYGSSPAGKEEWKKYLLSFMADWDSIHLIYPDFLPGIDSATHEFDGSVRYYGFWNGVHKNGTHTSVNFYATYDFNKEGKIVNASEFFDVGGMMKALENKKPGIRNKE